MYLRVARVGAGCALHCAPKNDGLIKNGFCLTLSIRCRYCIVDAVWVVYWFYDMAAVLCLIFELGFVDWFS